MLNLGHYASLLMVFTFLMAKKRHNLIFVHHWFAGPRGVWKEVPFLLSVPSLHPRFLNLWRPTENTFTSHKVNWFTSHKRSFPASTLGGKASKNETFPPTAPGSAKLWESPHHHLVLVDGGPKKHLNQNHLVSWLGSLIPTGRIQPPTSGGSDPALRKEGHWGHIDPIHQRTPVLRRLVL